MASGAAHSSPVASTEEVQPGVVIADRYRLTRSIGTGGMATIWEATHLALKRSIALKLITIHGASPQKISERFLREARVAAAVRHRNVVDILDFGTCDDGRPFMAMELLVGQTLADRMNEEPPPSVGEAVRIMAQVLSGLASVHDAGIVHRDLKPENVFLAEDGDGVVPKLLDFGVSRALDPTGELKSVMPTIDNVIVGTPQYMSPEQARALRTVDQRSDLWGAGVILFELLTGQLPFDADAIGDVIVQIATKEPPDLASLRPDLAGPIADVVRTAMRREPSQRYQSAEKMRAALLQAVANTAQALRDRTPEFRMHAAPTSADELFAAVGDAYEPGDSGLLPVGRLRPPEPPRDTAPAPMETLPSPSAPPIAPKKPRRWLGRAALFVSVAIAAGVTATALLTRPQAATLPAEPPPPAAPIEAAQALAKVAIASELRAIDEQEAPEDPEPVTSEDAEPPSSAEDSSDRAPRPSPRPAGASLPPLRADGLLRDPGF